jgi:hypothetical protein
MATKNIFASMLNQKPIAAPQLNAGLIHVQKSPGSGEFAYVSNPSTAYKHPLINSGKDIAKSAWASLLSNMKTKGV